MRARGAIALLPLLVACGVTAGCSPGDPTVPRASQVLNCGRVVDEDASGYLGGPLTAERAIGLLIAVQRSGGAARIPTGKLSGPDRSTLYIVAVDLIGYSGSKLSDDATAFARAELSYDPDSGAPVDTSYGRSVELGINALARDCPYRLAPGVQRTDGGG
jgi:hypothetical protein